MENLKALRHQKVIARKGSITDLPQEASEFGMRGLVVHGASLEKNGVKHRLLPIFNKSNLLAGWHSRTGGEPVLDEISAVIKEARALDATWIAGIGGGSVLDLAKAAAGLYHAAQKPVYYQEGGALETPGIPFIAVPTTAGTGSEATNNSVIINPEKKQKLSIRDNSFTARKVILDAELLHGLPPQVIKYSGLDALVQAYEAFISKNSTAESDALALEAVRLISRHLPECFGAKAENHFEPLLLGSYKTGLAFSQSRLGVIHGIAHPLGVLYDVPHGLVCAVCFAPSIKLNLEAMGRKYDTLSEIMGTDFLKSVEDVLNKLEIRSPFKGQAVLEEEKIIRETLGSGSTAANPKIITREDVQFLLHEIF
jgi:alcohol dehydrogenase class IV